MDFIFSILKIIFFGFFGLIGLLFLLALIFGKRIVKQWEYEAEFRDGGGREFGEFDIELSRVASKGQICRVAYGGVEQFSQVIVED